MLSQLLAFTLRQSSHKMLTIPSNDPNFLGLMLSRQVLTHLKLIHQAMRSAGQARDLHEDDGAEDPPDADDADVSQHGANDDDAGQNGAGLDPPHQHPHTRLLNTTSLLK